MVRKKKDGLTYAKSGVNIDEADLFTRMIKERVAEAWPDTAVEIGGFAGGGPIPKGSIKVDGSVDGVGTKLKIAGILGKLDTVGQDAVAMSAVDGYIAGAKPEYLMDYLAVEKLKAEYHIQIIEGLIRACKLAGCKLIGGETAELPGFFKYSWLFDLTTSVISFRKNKPKYVPVKGGFDLYGWPSFGPASNGYSLLRNIFNLDDAPSRVRKRLEKRWSELDGKSLGECLLEPTPIWIDTIENEVSKGVRFAGHAHMTGGGIENIKRILPADIKVIIDRSSWRRPAIFGLAQRLGNVSTEEMERVFNNGNMVVSIVDPAGPAIEEHAIKIGSVVEWIWGENQVEMFGQYRD